MNINLEHEFGDSVYFKTDPHQLEHLITGFLIRPGGIVIYYLSYGGVEERAYNFELITEKRIF